MKTGEPVGHRERVLQAGDTTGTGFCSGLLRGKGTRGQTGRHTAGSFPPTLHQGGASATPSHFSQVTAWRLFTHGFRILPRGKQGPSHLLFVAGLPSRLSGRSMGHPPRSAAAADANSLPPSLGRTENGPAAWRAPGGEQGNDLLRPATPSWGPTCAPGCSGLSEPVCPPLPPSQQLWLRPT